MLPCDLFSLILATNTSACSNSKDNQQTLQILIKQLLKSKESPSVRDHNSLIRKLVGWNTILQEYLNDNYLTDVQTINYPRELSEDPMLKKIQEFRIRIKILSEIEKKKTKRLVFDDEEVQEEDEVEDEQVEEDDTVEEACKHYIFASTMPPGRHQFLLYCPRTERAFCQEVIVHPNTFDPFPEYPINV